MKLGRFDIDSDQRCLLLDGKVVPLGVRAFDILAALVGAGGRTVSRAELMKTVWPNVIVEDCNIDQHVCALRKALGADRHLIVTVARRGYRCAMAQVAPAPRTIAPSGPNTNAPTRLPLRRTLRGREAAVAAIAALVQRSPLVTITGTGGIGKTSLAIEVAHELAGQSCARVDFVDLGEAHDERAVLLAIAQGCGLDRTALTSRAAR